MLTETDNDRQKVMTYPQMELLSRWAKKNNTKNTICTSNKIITDFFSTNIWIKNITSPTINHWEITKIQNTVVDYVKYTLNLLNQAEMTYHILQTIHNQ